MQSKCFMAKLPDLTEESRLKVERWAAANTAVWKLLPATDKSYILVCMREAARTAKMNCRLLRAGLARAGVVLPTNKRGWLCLVSQGEELDSLMGPNALKPKEPEEDADGERTILLPSARTRRRRIEIDVVKEESPEDQQASSAGVPRSSSNAR